MAKKKTLTIEDRAERYRQNQLTLNKANAALDKKISDAKAAYQQSVATIQEELEEDIAAIHEHADDYRERMFEGGKSTDWYGLKLSYRLNAKSIKIIETTDQEEVLSKLKALELFELISTTSKLDKKAVLKALEEDAKIAKKLKQIGLEVTQTETFSVKV